VAAGARYFAVTPLQNAAAHPASYRTEFLAHLGGEADHLLPYPADQTVRYLAVQFSKTRGMEMLTVQQAAARSARSGLTRRSVLLGALGIGAAALSACAGTASRSGSGNVPAPSTGPVTVTAFIGLPATQTAAFTSQITDAYKKVHPNVTLNGLPQPGGGTQAVVEKLTSLVAGGTPPDIFDSPRYPDVMVEKGFIDTSMDEFVKRDHYQTDAYNPKEFAAKCIYQGKVVQMPFKLGGNSLVILCNGDLFREAGVPLPSTDLNKVWSWDDWVQAAEKLTKRNGDTVTQFGHNGLAWTIGSWPLLWQTDWIAPDIKTIICDNPAMVDCYTHLQDLYYKSRIVPLPGQAAKVFGNGDPFLSAKAAMQIVAVSNWSTYTEQNPRASTHIAPIPKVKISTPDVNSQEFSIVKGSAHPADAWEAIKFMIEDARINYVTLRFPARLDYLDGYVKSTIKETPGIDSNLVLEVAKNFVPQTLLGQTANQDQMLNLINPKLNDLWANTVTPTAMLTGLKAPLQTLANT
jgi:multiple sugar transport system substrate-binding protein